MLHRVRFRERVFIEAPPPENDGYCAKLNDHEHRHSRCCNIFFFSIFSNHHMQDERIRIFKGKQMWANGRYRQLMGKIWKS